MTVLFVSFFPILILFIYFSCHTGKNSQYKGEANILISFMVSKGKTLTSYIKCDVYSSFFVDTLFSLPLFVSSQCQSYCLFKYNRSFFPPAAFKMFSLSFTFCSFTVIYPGMGFFGLLLSCWGSYSFMNLCPESFINFGILFISIFIASVLFYLSPPSGIPVIPMLSLYTTSHISLNLLKCIILPFSPFASVGIYFANLFY